MFGFMYRVAVALKDFGERVNLGFFIRLGLALKNFVLERSKAEDFMTGGGRR